MQTTKCRHVYLSRAFDCDKLSFIFKHALRRAQLEVRKNKLHLCTLCIVRKVRVSVWHLCFNVQAVDVEPKQCQGQKPYLSGHRRVLVDCRGRAAISCCTVSGSRFVHTLQLVHPCIGLGTAMPISRFRGEYFFVEFLSLPARCGVRR